MDFNTPQALSVKPSLLSVFDKVIHYPRLAGTLSVTHPAGLEFVAFVLMDTPIVLALSWLEQEDSLRFEPSLGYIDLVPDWSSLLVRPCLKHSNICTCMHIHTQTKYQNS